MNHSLHASSVIAKRNIFETAITPGFYIALSLGSLLGFFAVRGFTLSIDSNGFNPTLNPIYDMVARFLVGLFGEAFFIEVFAEGPFTFALYISFLPVLLYLTISSVVRSSLEKNVGALELILYGPADTRSYLLGSLLKDIVFTAVSLLFLTVTFACTALANNPVLGPEFTTSVFVLFFSTMTICSYALLSTSITSSGSSAVALFIVIMAVFLFIQAGSYVIISTYVRNLSSIISWLLRWISPFYYSGLCMQLLSDGRLILLILLLLVFPVLSALLLIVSAAVMNKRGVRS